MADALKGAAAPILPAALAVSFSLAFFATPPTLADRLAKLAQGAATVHALVTDCNDLLPGDSGGGVLLSLAGRLAEPMLSALTDSNWPGMALVEVAKLQGGAA